MVTLSNTLTSVLAGNAQFSDPVTKVIYDQFSKVPLRLWLVSTAVRGWGGGEMHHHPEVGEKLGEEVNEKTERGR